MRVAGIILAAGGSTRLGSPKQLLEYRGRTLLRRAAEAVLATMCHPVVVVLGSGAETICAELDGLDVQMVVNPDWQRGMGGSVRQGMTALTKQTELDAVLLTLCDQPMVGTRELARLLDAWCNAQPYSLAAAEYGGTPGVPAVFGREHFAELSALPDAAGAKRILQHHATQLLTVSMPEAATDVDTREQYENLGR